MNDMNLNFVRRLLDIKINYKEFDFNDLPNYILSRYALKKHYLVMTLKKRRKN